MISYRKFFSICLMMAVLFFMFQFLQLYKEMGNEYSTNQYMEGERLSGEGRWQAKEGEGEYVLFVGKEGSDAQRVASQWCLYTKRRLTLCPALDEKHLEEEELPRLVLLEGNGTDFGTQTEQIAEMARKGVPIVFLNLPSFSVIEENAGLRRASFRRTDQRRSKGGNPQRTPVFCGQSHLQAVCRDMAFFPPNPPLFLGRFGENTKNQILLNSGVRFSKMA